MFVCFLSASAQEQTSDLTWLTNLDEAKFQAKKEKKTILMYFTGSDWCSPCKMLKEDFFSTEKFKAQAADYVLVMVDYPRRVDILTPEQLVYNKELVSKYNKDGVFPKLMAMNAKGKKLGEITGYSPLRDPSNYFNFVAKY